MDHKKFISGQITTAFIAEEYSEGFDGVDLTDDKIQDLAACAAAMNRVAEIRRTKISGRMDNHERRVGDDWVVQIAGKVFLVNVLADTAGANVIFEDETSIRVSGDWLPGKKLANMTAGDKSLVIKGYGFNEIFPVMLDPTAPGRLGRDGLNENVHNYFMNILGRGGVLQLILFFNKIDI